MSLDDQEEVSMLLSATSNATTTAENVRREGSKVAKKLADNEYDGMSFHRRLFEALDVKLSLYFTSHTSMANLDTILKELSLVLRRELKISMVLEILSIWPESFKVCQTTNDVYLIGITKTEGRDIDALTRRKSIFESRLAKLGQNEQEINIDRVKIDVIVDPVQRIRAMKNRKIQKKASDLDFKEKIITTTATGTTVGGEGKKLSVLERIKLKEKQRLEAKKALNKDDKDGEQNDADKLQRVYNILFTLTRNNNNATSNGATTTFTLMNLSQKIKDSYKTNIHEDDIMNNLNKICQILDGKVKTIDINEMKFIRINNNELDRNKDIKEIIKFSH